MSAARRSIATTEAGVTGADGPEGGLIRSLNRGLNRGRRVIVAGGGIGGLTAALCLARGGADVTLLEQAPALTEVGAGIQITPNGAAVLDALGLSAALDGCAIRALGVVPTDAVRGHALARFDLSVLPGQPYRFVHRADLIACLARAAAAAGVTVRTATRVQAIAPEGVVSLADNTDMTADLVIGAEGLQSRLRSVLNGAGDPPFTGQVAWRAVIAHDGAPAEARIWMAPGRHVVTYPLPGHRLNIVAVQERAEWAAEGWHHPDDPANLRAAFADTCPALRALLEQVTAPRLWGLFRHPVAGIWHGPRAVLVGDAAHPTLPFLAQGANLAIEDACVLARLCDAHDLADALPRYQALRAPRVARAIAAANANAVNYHLSGPRRMIAHAGLRALGRLAPGAFLRRMDWLYGADVTRDPALR